MDRAQGRKKPAIAIAIGAALAMVAAAALRARTPTSPGVPVASVPVTERDFGAVKRGVVLRAQFHVENRGGRRLVLHARPERCCSQSPADVHLVISPGEKRALEVEADTKLWHGELTHSVEYATNDPKTPLIRLTLTAVVADSDDDR